MNLLKGKCLKDFVMFADSLTGLPVIAVMMACCAFRTISSATQFQAESQSVKMGAKAIASGLIEVFAYLVEQLHKAAPIALKALKSADPMPNLSNLQGAVSPQLGPLQRILPLQLLQQIQQQEG